MKDCIFCKIIRNEIQSVKVWEDENHMAILDIMPNTEGSTLVIPKEHIESNFSNVSDKELSEIILAAKKVAKLLEKKLNVERVALVIEGLEINHLHVKLYPIGKDYKGYLTTKAGEQKTVEELEEIARRIRE